MDKHASPHVYSMGAVEGMIASGGSLFHSHSELQFA